MFVHVGHSREKSASKRCAVDRHTHIFQRLAEGQVRGVSVEQGDKPLARDVLGSILWLRIQPLDSCFCQVSLFPRWPDGVA